jgi:uncharacterized protein (TIGR04255 family)
MAKARRHLSNAPIKEAVIEFRVQLEKEFRLERFDGLLKLLDPDYVKVGPIVEIEADLSVSSDGASSGKAHSRTLGIRLNSRDNKYVAQISRTAFAFSRLAPYETWEKLLEEAKRVWTAYVTCASPQRITRIATRFINDLQLPMQPGEEFDVYLTKPPEIPAALPQMVNAFLQRVVIHNVELDIGASLTQVLQSGVMTDRVPIILDIDVFRSAEFDPSSRETWDCLACLRDFKNRIFFESITEKTVELYV